MNGINKEFEMALTSTYALAQHLSYEPVSTPSEIDQVIKYFHKKSKKINIKSY